ncbi:hypothetical protein GCM10023205_76730 [Yinghuangia aomiensis]|uniref:Uncharacterized protein n=1 Tax=Yinghuangia aomiensis TaxID=676205 RepID=A0ABP9I9S3_9ACTN
MTSTYQLTPYAPGTDATAKSAPLPRVPVTGGILDVLAVIRPWFDERAAAVVHVHRDGALVARLAAADLAATDGITYTRPDHADPRPRPAATLGQAVLLAGAWIAPTPAKARAGVQRDGVWVLSVDATDFPGAAELADERPDKARWTEWPSWREEPPAAYITDVAESLRDGFGWTIAETSHDGFSVDFSPKEPEPHHSWTDHQVGGDYWWATFIPRLGWASGMKSTGPQRPRRQATRDFPLPVPADPGHPDEVAVYLALALEHGPLGHAAADA